MSTYLCNKALLNSVNFREHYPLSFQFPVNVQNNLENQWSAFLMDLLLQGYGRKGLLNQLGFSINAEEQADWPLLKSGAGNPIGNLLIKEAYDWIQDHFPTVKPRGFSLSEIIERKEDFIESLASYGLFVAGSSGVQGEWPKLLLTQGYDGFFYLDHSLPDQLAAKHWLVKFSRGNDQKLEKILLHEAIDMKIARYLGLRVLKDLELHQRTLFNPRFDRQIIKAMRQTIRRWHLHLMCNRELSDLSAIFNRLCCINM